MRGHYPYIPLSQEQIKTAQHTDIAQFLISRGEKVRKEGKHYVWEKHDSCVITGFRWYQNSTGEHGAAVAFMQHFFDMRFPEAVLALTENRAFYLDTPPQQSKRDMPIVFRLPPSAPDHRRLFAYLTITRGISPEIVNDFLEERLIYQDKRGNVVFVCYDKEDVARAAHLRGTATGQRFRGFLEGGDFSCGFSFNGKDSSSLYVFEAPIDLLSFITLHRHENWRTKSYLSLGGLSDISLNRYLSEHPEINEIHFCLDNDPKGKEKTVSFLLEYQKGKLARRYSVWEDLPPKKDWNKTLTDLIKKGEFR